LPLKGIQAENLLPLETGLVFPALPLTTLEADKIRNGQKIGCKVGGGCAEFSAGFSEGRLLAILQYETEKHTLKPIKVFLD
jgi:hypothetical protein